MKNFIIALCFLILITAAVAGNCVFARSLYSDIYDSLENLPPVYSGHNDSELTKTTALIDKNKVYLYFTAPHGMINDLLCDYTEMAEYFYAGDTPSYLAFLEKVKLRVQILKKSESLPFSHFTIGNG